MHRIADGVAIGFITYFVLTLAASIAAFALQPIEIQLLLTVQAALPQGRPEVELPANPFGFVMLLVLVATVYAVVARRRSTSEPGTPVSPDSSLQSTGHRTS